MLTPKVVVSLSAAILLLPHAALADSELVRNGGMEGPFPSGLAAGWVKNCYGANEFVFAEETRDVHGGKSAQRVTCTKFTDGGVQFHSAFLAVENGKPYTVRVWMKGDVRSSVYIGLRKHNEPYTGYLVRHARVKDQWRPYLLSGASRGAD